MQNIRDTGVRGYLKWLQADQPNVYRAVAPMLVQRYPQLFSDREQSKALGILTGTDTTGGAVPGDATASDSSVTGASGDGTDVANAANTGAASPSIITDIGNAVSNVIQQVRSAQLNKQVADAYAKYNDIQLQHAAAGGVPLQISTTAMGIPLITQTAGVAALPGNKTLWYIGGAVAALWLMRKVLR